jgi:hypothetical protein
VAGLHLFTNRSRAEPSTVSFDAGRPTGIVSSVLSPPDRSSFHSRPRPFCSPPLALGGWAMVLASSPLLFSPLALGGWAMMLDCWFLPESPWKKAQHRRRAVSVSVRTAASSWEPSKQSLEPAKAQYSVDEHAPLAMVALWCCAGCFFHQP